MCVAIVEIDVIDLFLHDEKVMIKLVYLENEKSL